MRKTIAILGIPIDKLDQDETLERMDEFIQSRRFHQVATANTDFLIKSLHDPELHNILIHADLVIPDGMPIVKASQWLKSPLKERVTGADMVPRLAVLAAQKGYRLFMLGARPDVAQRARQRMETDNPGLQIVGCVSPEVNPIVTMDNDTLLAEIAAAKPDILLVAFGNPKQEKWIAMHRDRLDIPLCIGVGGTFDFLAGEVARAPVWMQRSGLEWLHRLTQEPKRLWKRYTSDLVHFARLMTLELFVMRRAGGNVEPRLRQTRSGDCTILSVVGSLDQRILSDFAYQADHALTQGTHLVLDITGATRIDSSVLGTLLNLSKRAEYAEREIRLVGLNGRVRSALRLARAESLFQSYPSLADALIGTESEPLDIEVEFNETDAVLTLRGSADKLQTIALEARLQSLPASLQNLDLDLRGVTYIDCGMLSLLGRLSNQWTQANRSLRVIPNAVVTRTLVREKLTGLLPLSETPRQVVTPRMALRA